MEMFCDRYFTDWLAREQISLACTTYQTSRLMLLGVNPENGSVSGFERIFDRAMGLYATTERMYLSTKYQIWQIDNVLEAGQAYNGYDKLYIPRIGYTTGDLDVHDLVVDDTGKLIFASTMLNCLATLSDRHSCKPIWKPNFISKIINEDRCHLNGLAMVEGKPKYTTSCSRSDAIDGWRDRRRNGGCVIDVPSGEIIFTGLSMPHSPRWYRDRLWLLNSGTGEFGYVDLQAGKFEAIAFCPGFLRGLAFHQDYAIVGLSKPRGGDRTFSGLPLDDRLMAKDTDPQCGLMAIDLRTGAIAHWFRFEGIITELYDVQVLPQVKRPMALGFQTEEIVQLITLEPLQEETGRAISEPPKEEMARAIASESLQEATARVTDSKPLKEEESIRLEYKNLVIKSHQDGGFFSNFNKVLNWLSRIDRECNVWVDWMYTGTESAFRYGDAIGENIWEIFFEPISNAVPVADAVVQDLYIDFTMTGAGAHLMYLGTDFQSVRNRYGQIFTEFIRVRSELQAEAERIYAELMDGYFCIGVHKRHQLHRVEDFYLQPVPIPNIIDAIRKVMPSTGKVRVFLATDEEDAIAAFSEAFDDRLIYQAEAARSPAVARQEIHWNREYRGSYLGKQVLMDALLLARCQILVHGVSNLSTAVLMMNPQVQTVYLYQDDQGQTQIHAPQTPPFADRPASIVDPAQALFDRARYAKHYNMGEEAELSLREAIRLQPGHWGACNNLGTMLQQRGKVSEAKTFYEQALRFKPDFGEAISNLASTWQLDDELERAKAGFIKALQLKPDYVPAHFNLATIYKQQGRLGAAVDHFQRVVELRPNYHQAHFQLALIYEYQEKLEEALNSYTILRQIHPQDGETYDILESIIYRRLCDWSDYDRRQQAIIDYIQSPSKTSPGAINPFVLSSFPLPLSLHHSAAREFALNIQQAAAKTRERLNFQHLRDQTPKLRVGYISPDFREHAVGRLVHDMFRYHDREEFEVYVYSTVDFNDRITQHIREHCDVFVDLSLLSTEAAARRIHADGIQILIDLAGYTVNNGSEILALQPAPIQAQFLGYPDTMGADFMQYAIADRWLISPEIAASYTEEIIYLPHAFGASPLEISDRAMTRSEFGVPELAFVFCCFNSHYKIEPEVFGAWMEILTAVPHAVLWLTGSAPRITDNLRSHATRHGIDPARLIFTEKLPHAEYMARYRLADLYLDTFIYNAGSTATAALWAGVPLLTKLGNTNASRMGASICAAAGLEDLICDRTETYLQKAIHLATHPQELAEIRNRLQENRDRLPLFDLKGFVRSLEVAFRQMWDSD
ncbi:TIGR03032 family protein [Pseudanabaena sp. PCC 6802]|uniref:TIGR03032 family protein n=1 Tax=Pseudanabaena sp. PCC 6802 TaxID=118173 RepID=UPI000345E07E|nr:TIGR03032 family protein [Pseudanabaena sp. PCC 6802]